jgi:hypothetical protein
MPAVSRFVKILHKDVSPTVTFTNTYDQSRRIDLPIPTYEITGKLGDSRLKGEVGQVRLYGTAQTGGAKTLTIFWAKNQAGTDVLYGSATANVFTSPFVSGGWVANFDYKQLMVIEPDDHPEGTISLFGIVSSGTLTCSHVDFFYLND